MKRLSKSLEQAGRRYSALRLDSIRYKMLVFAVVATIVPSFSTAWLSYLQNRSALTTKISGDLVSMSGAVSRELDLWFKGNLYNLRIFTNSYEVTGNVDRDARSPRTNLSRLTDYLRSLQRRFPDDFDELVVVDPQGRTVATSATQSRPVPLPADWRAQLRADNSVVGAPLPMDSGATPTLVIAVPVPVPSGRFVGAFAARLKLRAVERIVKRSVPSPAGATFASTPEGALIASSRTGMDRYLRDTVAANSLRAIAADSGAVEYRSFDGENAVASSGQVPRLHWAVVSEVPSARAYQQVNHLRNVTIEVLLALLAVIGAIAYFLSMLIVRPLNRLSQAASKVAAGDLGVELPVAGGGEVAFLTQVFNAMVVRLREKTEELERLSITDGLTGLLNRRRLMEELADEVKRSQRLEHTFALLMVDVDHFKKYNDSFGHLAGDEVLVTVAKTLKEQTREVDFVARYGGEEFLVLLPDVDEVGAHATAERLRESVGGRPVAGLPVTVSAGCATWGPGESPDDLLRRADAAMYAAKRGGRDQVAQAAS